MTKLLRLGVGIGVVASALLVSSLPLAGAASAQGGKPTAIVSMGDSYISGEGGRWLGNSEDPTFSRSGTDRAYVAPLSWDARRVYGASYDNGCHRADVAEIMTSGINVDQRINLACSGAETVHLLRSSSGGQGFKGERPQADQLADVARTHDIKLIAISIGGNDLRFSDLLSKCVTGYVGSAATNPTTCAGEGQRVIDEMLPGAKQRTAKIIDDIRAVMSDNGKGFDTYRIILQSGPSAFPVGSENRYPQEGLARFATGGCPLWNTDLNWVRNGVTQQFADAVRNVAIAKDVDFLDLQNLFQGREVCAKDSELVDANHPPNPRKSEWVRFLTLGVTQGDFTESLHPNYFGHQAMGMCLGLAYANGRGNVACRNRPGMPPDDVYLTSS